MKLKYFIIDITNYLLHDISFKFTNDIDDGEFLGYLVSCSPPLREIFAFRQKIRSQSECMRS